ncbi:MAG: hypothetical protein ACOYKN_19895, partial [Pirellula sp.]
MQPVTILSASDSTSGSGNKNPDVFQGCQPTLGSVRITTRRLVDHELRDNQAEFWSLEFEPLPCLILQDRDRGIFARPSSRVTDNRSFYVNGIHITILPQRTAMVTEVAKKSTDLSMP